MRIQFSEFAYVAGVLLALALTFGCTSDIELPPPPLDYSSSAEDTGSSSSSSLSVGNVLCLFGDSCPLIPFEDCSAIGGQIVQSCPTASSSSAKASSSSEATVPSSSSVAEISSSSSSLPAGTVWCMVGENCVSIAPETCIILGGQQVQSCPAASSSSIALPSSSSVVPSSSSVVPIAPSSSSAPLPSSSSTPSSSSIALPSSNSVGTGLCDGFVNGTMRKHYGKEKEQFCDERDGKKYVYVTIGEQVWMAENLNYADPDSKCSNCETYGRLYNWATATTACPSGWHLPSKAEWTTLTNYAGGASTALIKLKATSGWNGNGNGQDTYGFSALPGGYGYPNGGFGGDGGGYWWSATENYANDAYGLGMYYYYEAVDYSSHDKHNLRSVRCVKD